MPYRPLVPAIVLAALAGCQQPSATAATDGWVRLAAAPGRPAAAYFTLTGGPTDQTLLSVTSPLAIRSELHESMRAGPGMTMRPIGQLALPARGRIVFAPGGKHVMLFDVNAAVKPGGQVPLEFTFTDGSRLRSSALAIAAGDPPPKF